jgi:hypothetical protein
MPEKSADKFSDFIFSDPQMDDAITQVTESSIIEVEISGKKVGSAETVQQEDNLIFIIHPMPANMNTDTNEADTS